MIFSNIDFNDNEPIYMQIENYIKKMIENNMVAVRSALRPSVPASIPARAVRLTLPMVQPIVRVAAAF